MKMGTSDKSIIIIGGGFAGLSAGIYAQLNGYNTQIFEMHDQPGGLCTSWNRKGYTFDGCIHWLVGSSLKSGMHDRLAENRPAYLQKKEEIGRTIRELLDQRFPGFSSQVEVTDVATPLTFERYTGNWKGTYEGWLLTPENAKVLMNPMSQTLPDLKNFYMCGQWVEPGGGLPTAIMSGRRLAKKICREDHFKFKC